MRGLMPFIALAIVGTYGLMVLVGLAGVAYGGYYLVTSDFSWRRGARSSSNSSTTTPPPSYTKSFKSSSPAFNPPPPQAFNPPPPPAFNPPPPPVFNPPGFGTTKSEGLDVNANSNFVIKRFLGRVQVSASSEWNGWPARNAIDGNPGSSWFPSTSGGNVTEGPWIMLSFPQDTPLRRLTVLGNRDATWKGYGIRRLKVDFLDIGDQVLRTTITIPTKGSDFDFANLNLPRVRKIRLTSLEDENGQTNRGQQVGIAEIQVE